MKILLAGASGVAGRRLVPELLARGHHVTGITRSDESAGLVRGLGAEAVRCDVLDRESAMKAVNESRPDAIVQHLTDLPQNLGARGVARAYDANDHLRELGTENLVAAALAVGVRRYVAQNVCFLYATSGGAIKDESSPLLSDRRPPLSRTMRVYRKLEALVTESPGIDGTVLRFGFWYGPGTTFAAKGRTAREVKGRRYPIVGHGAGIFSFVHLDDVVGATIAALERTAPGIYNICDDEPAPMSEWLPVYARAVGASAPLRVPRWLARLAVGHVPVYWATEMRGASNEKARRELGWQPRWPSWREGFAQDLADQQTPTTLPKIDSSVRL